jgi:hypothetical protein
MYDNIVYNKIASRCPYVCLLDLLNCPMDIDAVFLVNRKIQEEGLYV